MGVAVKVVSGNRIGTAGLAQALILKATSGPEPDTASARC